MATPPNRASPEEVEALLAYIQKRQRGRPLTVPPSLVKEALAQGVNAQSKLQESQGKMTLLRERVASIRATLELQQTRDELQQNLKELEARRNKLQTAVNDSHALSHVLQAEKREAATALQGMKEQQYSAQNNPRDKLLSGMSQITLDLAAFT